MVGVLAALTALAAPAASVSVKWTDKGLLDFDYGSVTQSAGGAATGERAESKLFYTPDGRWWAALGTTTGAEGSGVYLYEHVGHAWVPQFKFPSSDPWMKADTLFEDPNHLFVSMRDQKANSGTNLRQSLLYRYAYEGDGVWSAVSTATLITSKNPEVLTIAHDSQDRRMGNVGGRGLHQGGAHPTGWHNFHHSNEHPDRDVRRARSIRMMSPL